MSPGARLAGAAALLGALLYLDALPNGFVFDDRPVVERNEQIRSLANLPSIFRTPYQRYYGLDSGKGGHYRPLPIATFALDHAVFGPRPLGYHVTNLLLHAAASGLVVLTGLAAGLAVPVAFGGGLLFAVHPVHTEVVANLAGRAELLAAVFSLLSLLFYVRGRTGSSRGTSLALASFFLLLALLSKENAVTLVAIAAAWEALLGPRASGRRLRDAAVGLAWLLVPVVAYFGIRGAVLGSALAPLATIPVLANPLVEQGLRVRFLTATAVVARYLVLLIFPWRLSPDYSYAQIVPVERVGDPTFLAGALAIVAIGILGYLALRRVRPLAFQVLFGVLSFSVVSNFPIAIATIMAERLLYLPSVAFCFLAAALWALARERVGSRIALVAGIAVLSAFSARTVARNLDWRSDFALFTKARTTSPRSAKVLNNLGAELLKRGDNRRALELLFEARSIAPGWGQLRVNLAQALLVTGNPDRAEEEAREAVRILPRDALAQVKLAEVLEARGNLGQAARALEEALLLDPHDAEARIRLGTIATSLRDYSTAERELTTAVRELPDSIPAHTALGFLYAWMGRRDGAVVEMREAVRLDPKSPQARNNLGNALRDAGELEDSIRELEQAIATDERIAASHYNLGLSLEKAGRTDDARRQYQRALELEPRHRASAEALRRLS